MLHTSAFVSAQNAPRRNTQTRTQQPDITYTVSMPKPHTHLLAVEMRVKLNANSSAANAEIDLVMPVWTPGSYLVREYARHVQNFAATDASGRNLRWSKTNKNTWRVVLNNAREMRATYSVYANELTVRTNELNDRHAFWNNAALLMYVDKQLAAPATLRVVPFGVWKVATGLPASPDKRTPSALKTSMCSMILRLKSARLRHSNLGFATSRIESSLRATVTITQSGCEPMCRRS